MLFASRALCVLFLCIYCFIPAFAQANANEIDVRQAVEEETSRLLTKRDYRALERLYLKYQDTSERTPSGAWKLYFFDAALNTFIQQNAVRLNQDGESIALYARIYWNHNQAITQGRLFQETNAIWPLMKQGFEKLTSLFPTPHNYSAFAYFSCLSGDIESFKKLKLEHNAGSTMTGWGSSATGLGSQAFEAECSAR